MSQQSSTGQKKFFRSERPLVVITRHGSAPPASQQKQPVPSSSNAKTPAGGGDCGNHSRRATTNAPTSTSMKTISRKEDNEVTIVNDKQRKSVSSKVGDANSKGIIRPSLVKKLEETKPNIINANTSGLKENTSRSKLQDKYEVESNISTDTDEVPPSKPVKRRTPGKGSLPKINKMTGGRLKVPEPKPKAKTPSNTKKVKRDSSSDSSLYESDRELSDDELQNFDKNINHLMLQLGAKIESRIEFRVEKLSNAFEGVMTVPRKIAKFETEQNKRKQAIMDDFRTKFSVIEEKLQKVVAIQKNNVEKCSKLFQEGAKAQENNKKTIAECKQRHNVALTNYLKGVEKFQTELADEEKQCMDQGNKEIRKVRQQLMLEGELQSSEVIKKL